MKYATRATRPGFAQLPRLAPRLLPRLALLAACAVLLAACETTGSIGSATLAAAPDEPPMTRSRAAADCWMSTEKGGAAANLDKRADLVGKCIDEKMKAAPGPPKV